jgi:hypothetical protein
MRCRWCLAVSLPGLVVLLIVIVGLVTFDFQLALRNHESEQLILNVTDQALRDSLRILQLSRRLVIGEKRELTTNVSVRGWLLFREDRVHFNITIYCYLDFRPEYTLLLSTRPRFAPDLQLDHHLCTTNTSECAVRILSIYNPCARNVEGLAHNIALEQSWLQADFIYFSLTDLDSGSSSYNELLF